MDPHGPDHPGIDPAAGAAWPPARAGRGRRLLRWLARAAVAFVLGSVLVVGLLRWLPLPTSAVMLGDWIEHGRPPEHTWVAFEAVAPALALAVLAAEDQRFPDHAGFDFVEIQRALDEAEEGGRLRGASTLTQQVAKNVFLWSGRSWLRKGLEAWFTVLLEALWGKRRILEVYLNVAQFGSGLYGAEAAARRYFDKPARALTRAEAARLAAVLPNPERYRVEAPSAYVRGRAQRILEQMDRLGGTAFLERLD